MLYQRIYSFRLIDLAMFCISCFWSPSFGLLGFYAVIYRGKYHILRLLHRSSILRGRHSKLVYLLDLLGLFVEYLQKNKIICSMFSLFFFRSDLFISVSNKIRCRIINSVHGMLIFINISVIASEIVKLDAAFRFIKNVHCQKF